MNFSKIVLPLILAVGVSACGDGGGDDSNTTLGAAEGLWHGTTSTGRSIAGLVLDDGAYWFVYTAVDNSEVIAGAIQGNGSSSNGTFSSSNGKDFNLEGLGINDFTLTGDYAAKSSLSGALTYSSGGSMTFDSSYDTDYDSTPNLATIAGTYSGPSTSTGGPELVSVVISDTGAITGSGTSGCLFNGNATPGAKGNVYNVSITFEGGVCVNGTSTVSGVARFDTSSNQITSMALNSDRTGGFIYVGTKY